jgi:hypothetical protein
MLKIVFEWVAAVRWMLRMLPHFLVVAARQRSGRWFYFRDRPLWFVVTMADMPIEDPGASEQMRVIVTEARTELQRRLEQTMRTVEAAAPELKEQIAAIREELKKLGE